VRIVLDGSDTSRFVPVIMGFVGGLWCVRFFGLAVEIGPEGIVVRNLFRTMRLSWERIDGFRVQHGLGFGSPLGRTVSVLFYGGDALTIDATMSTRPSARGAVLRGGVLYPLPDSEPKR
jgi:hypothetical protein